MCVLYVCTEDTPDLDVLQANQVFNNDGNGYAWIDKGAVHWRKGIKTAEELYEGIRDLPLPILVHQRMRSAGSTHPGLTHPFPLGASIALAGRAKTVIAHNGTIFNWRAYLGVAEKTFGLKVRATDPWSDTRLLAWLLGRMDQDKLLKVLGQGQRIALLDAKKGVRIVNAASWWASPDQTGGYWQSADYSAYSDMVVFDWSKYTDWKEGKVCK